MGVGEESLQTLRRSKRASLHVSKDFPDIVSQKTHQQNTANATNPE
jgi:hypothetical protein